MKRYHPILVALATCALAPGAALALERVDDAPGEVLQPATLGDELPVALPSAWEEPSCELYEPSCEIGVACGDELGCAGGCYDACELGDAWTLQGYLHPCCDSPVYGGWFQFGYHSNNTGLSVDNGDLLDFNDVPDRFNLHQAWFYTEKLAEAEACSPDWGYRFDMLYGTDAQKTQAFGNTGAPNPRGWDNDWDHGIYGWAIPQLYGEVAYGDWSVKIGHFFTLIGYEVIPAPDNFFYSHALTMFNSEPFTHTGVIGTYSGFESTTLYAGWTAGWDTGFDQFGDGSSWLGGFSYEFSDDVTFTYMSTAGNFGWRSGDQDGYSHSLVLVAGLTDNLKYVFQSDYVHTNGSFGDPDTEGEDVGVNQYLFYTINDCWSVGGRAEWWKSDSTAFNPGSSTSFYEITGGINYKPCANLVFRPEVRYDWSPSDFDPDYDDVIFGIDMICTY